MAEINNVDGVLLCIEEVGNELVAREELTELAQDPAGVADLAKQAFTAVVSVAVVRYVIVRWREGHSTPPPEPLRMVDSCFSRKHSPDGQPIAAKILQALADPTVGILTSSMHSSVVELARANQQERLRRKGCSDRVVLLVAHSVEELAQTKGTEFAAALKELNRRFHQYDWDILYEGEAIKGRTVTGPRFVLVDEADEICSVEEALLFSEQRVAPERAVTSRPSSASSLSSVSDSPAEPVASSYLRNLIPELNMALAQEITACKGSRAQSYTLTQGRRVGERNRQDIYSFDVEVQIHIPDESPIAIRVGEEEVRGSLVAARDYVVVLALDQQVGERIPLATLLAEPWFLLEQLQLRMIELLTEPCGKAELLLRPAGARTTRASADVPCERDLDQDQQEAVRLVLGSDVAFIWGPPGTGKTTTLGATVAALMECGETVLVTAHSNVAVDVAMHAVLRWMPEEMHGSGEVLRFGPVYRRDLEDLRLITVEETVRRFHEDLVQELRSLQQQERALLEQTRVEHQAQQAWVQLKQIRLRLAPIEEKLDEVERELVRSARVVGCTLSKAAIAPEVIERRFDAVIVDEASMASIPACVYAASRANRRVAVFGDFRQLSPIATSNEDAAKRWLKRDIYQQAGIVEAVESGQQPDYLTALRTQYRMTSSICALVNGLAYEGMLQTADGLDERLRAQTELPPEPGRSVIVVDTERMKPYCYQEARAGGYSRFNPASALAALSIVSEVTQADASTSVALVTPFAAQARLLNAMLFDSGLQQRAVASTVHRFQGGEEDVVVLDLPDGRPQKGVSILLWQEENQEALRLLNVALSRAKAKVFVVAQTDWLDAKCAKRSALGQLLRQLIDRHTPFRFPTSKHADPSGLGRLMRQEEALYVLEDDIRGAKKELRLRYAAAVCDDTFPFDAIRNARTDNRVELGVDCLRASRDRLRQRLGCEVTITPLSPLETICRVDEQVLWLCSWVCPELSYADRPTIRLHGRRTVSVASALLGL